MCDCLAINRKKRRSCRCDSCYRLSVRNRHLLFAVLAEIAFIVEIAIAAAILFGAVAFEITALVALFVVIADAGLCIKIGGCYRTIIFFQSD